jgi:aerotaxis receptor
MKKNLPVTNQEVHLKENETIISTTDLKGIITWVNQPFMTISGFSEAELIGKNHNVIRHPDMPAAAFADLWATVKQGQSWRGMVKNRCKNGDHYWVEAFVSPVVSNGKTVGYQSVRSKPLPGQVSAAEKIYKNLNSNPQEKISKTKRLVDKSFFTQMVVIFLIAGILPLSGDVLWAVGLIPSWLMTVMAVASPLVLIAGLVYFHRFMIQPVRQLISHAENMSSGDLKSKIIVQTGDEVGQLQTALKMLQARFDTVIGKLSENSYNVLVMAEKLNVSSSQSYQKLSEQMVDISGVSVASVQMSESIQEVANSAETTAMATQNASDQTRKGTLLVEQLGKTVTRLVGEVSNTSNVIDELHSKSQDVTNIISTISSIAEQTNLLALNAAIEAARAGEQGRGFAVVADEVRNLAVKTQEATSEIHRVLEAMHSNINQAVAVMEEGKEQATLATDQSSETLQALSQISSEIANVNLMISQIATSATQQASGSEEISRRMRNISDQSSLNMSIAQMNSEISHQLGQSTEKIMRDFAFFDARLDVDEVIKTAISNANRDVEKISQTGQKTSSAEIDLF